MNAFWFHISELLSEDKKKKAEQKKKYFSSNPIILPTTISDLFWKIVKTKQKSLVWTKELIELWAKINSLCCILTEKKVETKLDDNIAFSPSFSLQIKKKESFPFSLMIFKKKLLFFLGRKRNILCFIQEPPWPLY